MPKFKVSKSKDEQFNIGLNYQSPDLDTAETITNVTASVAPAGLTLGTPGITTDDRGVYVKVSSGSEGKIYMVLFKVTTSSGKVFNNPDYDAITVKIIPIRKS